MLIVPRFCLATPSLSYRFVSPAPFLYLFTFWGYFRFETRRFQVRDGNGHSWWTSPRCQQGTFAKKSWICCLRVIFMAHIEFPEGCAGYDTQWPVRTHSTSILAGWYLHWTLCNIFSVDCPLLQLVAGNLSLCEAFCFWYSMVSELCPRSQVLGLVFVLQIFIRHIFFKNIYLT